MTGNKPKADMGIADEAYFQRISNDTRMFVYSAYFDYKKDQIRVIGVLGRVIPALYCILKYNNKLSPAIKYTMAYIQLIPEHKNLKYKAVFIICKLDKQKPPSTLTISMHTYLRNADNILPVHVPPTNKRRRRFTVCLSPLHNNFRHKMQLLEWLEMNMILGVDKVNVYVESCSSDVMAQLQMYQSRGFVTIINWPLPKYLCESSNKLLHYCGQLAALNDCLYRTKGYSQYIVSMDIDELIIPQKQEDMSWDDILYRLPSETVYLFRNLFFIRNKSREENEENFITQANILGHIPVFKAKDRSKYIAKVENVVTLGIHFVWAMNGSQQPVDPSVGLLHHYRSTAVKEIKQSNAVKHEVTKKYYHELRERMKQKNNS